MSNSDNNQTEQKLNITWFQTVGICLVILLIGAGILYVIYTSEPTAERAEGTKKTAMLVDVTQVETGTYRPEIEVMGTVEPAREIILRPRVSAEVMKRTREFTPGGIVQKGELLLQLDPSDFRNTLQQRKSELREARSNLKIEMGRQDVAQEEYQLLEENLSEQNKALVLRKPQLNSARAQVESARAAVDQAQLELKRTKIRAPFDAKILTRNVNVGSQVNVGDELAHLVGMDTYWVQATVPLNKLRWLTFPDSSTSNGATVKIRNRSAWGEEQYRTGHLHKLVGNLDERARMAKILIEVPDPLARESSSDSPPLIIDSYVQTIIPGKKIENAVRLNRDFLRENQTVWVMKDGKLDIRDVTVAFQDEGYAYITDNLNQGEKVITTNLSTVVEGSALRTDSTEQENNSSKSSNSSGDTI